MWEVVVLQLRNKRHHASRRLRQRHKRRLKWKKNLSGVKVSDGGYLKY